MHVIFHDVFITKRIIFVIIYENMYSYILMIYQQFGISLSNCKSDYMCKWNSYTSSKKLFNQYQLYLYHIYVNINFVHII